MAVGHDDDASGSLDGVVRTRHAWGDRQDERNADRAGGGARYEVALDSVVEARAPRPDDCDVPARRAPSRGIAAGDLRHA
jgi:hypothetical protein